MLAKFVSFSNNNVYRRKVPNFHINGNERGEKGQKISSKNRLWKEIFDRFRICNKCCRMCMNIVNEKRMLNGNESTIQKRILVALIYLIMCALRKRR